MSPARAARSPADDGGGRATSVAEALGNWERRLRGGGVDLPAGSGPRRMGPLFFDPQGADFTAWVNHFKSEVYRNWIVPQSVVMGMKGRVDLEFRVARDGRLVGLRLVAYSGTTALVRSAENALIGSRLLPLPKAYGPEEVAMSVSFFFNERPPAS